MELVEKGLLGPRAEKVFVGEETNAFVIEFLVVEGADENVVWNFGG